MPQPDYTELRRIMVEIIAAYAQASEEITGRSAFHDAVIRSMGEVPRHEFVPKDVQNYAYADGPLPIGHDKTISQPFIVALMVDLLAIEADDEILEVGTGLGYCAAVMSKLADKVFSMEIIEELATGARQRLNQFDYSNVEIRIGNGYYGWQEHAPYDKILVAAAPEQPPAPLIEQLKPGGRMVLPLGPLDEEQQLMLLKKDHTGSISMEPVLPVRFAPLVMAH
jgi:protein-L-isoaspartate(D-aspartate) O-methyltransferase